jgi:cysteine peptidase B
MVSAARVALLAGVFGASAVDVSDDAWRQWRQAHHREYDSEAEEGLRRSAWEAYSREVFERNARNPHARFVVDRFADLTAKEHRAMRGAVPPNTTAWRSRATLELDVRRLEASAIDWRGQLVTPVKDQSACGTCWSFSATGMQEAAWAKAGHPLTALSEQKLIDCGCGSGPYGIPLQGDCGGGLPSEADYPYVGPPSQCAASDACHDAPVTSNMESAECLDNCAPNDSSCGATAEPQILQWLQDGPVGVSVEASFGGYSSGIITDCEHRSLNHAVLIVGFGEENGLKYWIFKNSWGTGFGEEGYWRMQYGVNCLGFCGGGPCRAHAGSAPTPTQLV